MTIGLFGVCDTSTWRDRFIAAYEKEGIKFFNPNKGPGEWKPEDAEIEAEHLVTDDIILFPITGESYAFGSLAEVGFAVLSAVTTGRHVIVMVADAVDKALEVDVNQAKASFRARKLVLAHMRKLIEHIRNIHLVANLDDMLALSLELVAYHK